MNKVSATIARQRWAETLDAARREPVSITSHGRTIAVVMDPDLAQRALDALEELEDLADAAAALADVANGGPTYTLAEVAAELGIALHV
ncbi:hypothetical protein ART_4076 [Arthrobacter sp. PAMC 25486]|uniref:type II toxin-antitoxin system prevent-host-death family antitoxin n=1 Tax=Arthrobacter sp. PAMC 25486 TaxID=1494608 RepID=UPI00053600E1|nr:type II toxin-antitoxin system prevent-host-death family antitoxin [Arthrobacter sp. PAMC 25486]AIY03675.1 hypothetical protein ART_4076 [Arthrobacter sp. PAMC 25486]